VLFGPPYRFPLIVEGLAKLRSRSCIIDGEAVACSEDGIACFDHIRYRRHDGRVFLCAFDLIELDGEDMRRDPLAVRKATLASLLRREAIKRAHTEYIAATIPGAGLLTWSVKRSKRPAQCSAIAAGADCELGAYRPQD
jgi:ATP-dependent DNA ligase